MALAALQQKKRHCVRVQGVSLPKAWYTNALRLIWGRISHEHEATARQPGLVGGSGVSGGVGGCIAAGSHCTDHPLRPDLCGSAHFAGAGIVGRAVHCGACGAAARRAACRRQASRRPPAAQLCAGSTPGTRSDPGRADALSGAAPAAGRCPNPWPASPKRAVCW